MSMDSTDNVIKMSEIFNLLDNCVNCGMAYNLYVRNKALEMLVYNITSPTHVDVLITDLYTNITNLHEKHSKAHKEMLASFNMD